METKRVRRLSVWEKIGYGAGSPGNNLIYGLMTTYLLVFYTDYWGIPAAAAGWPRYGYGPAGEIILSGHCSRISSEDVHIRVV
jgi:hypothetical protein